MIYNFDIVEVILVIIIGFMTGFVLVWVIQEKMNDKKKRPEGKREKTSGL